MIEIIPAIDMIDGRCVRLSQGDYERCSVYNVRPEDMVRSFVDAGLERIHVVDLDGAKVSRPVNLLTLEKMAAINGARIEWGGGLKSRQALDDAFNAGASYAVVGSLAAKNPPLMAEWLRELGAARIILGADVRDGKISVNGWLEDTEMTIESLIDVLLPSGLNQVICTEISRDGTFAGPATDLYKELGSRYPSVVLTASGGIGKMADIETLAEAGIPRVIVGKALYEGRISLTQIMHYLHPSQTM